MCASTQLDANHPPLVVCVVVNWNGATDTITCLDALAQQHYPRLTTVVVNNGSTDDSVARIRSAHPSIEIVEATKNLGFAGGNNLGIRRALALRAGFVWLLNNDTIAPPDTCAKLVAKALSDPRAGLTGSVLYFMHDPARVQAWGGGNMTAWLARSSHFTFPAKISAKSYLTFASVLIRRDVLETVGLLDENFFMYFEDADYNLRTQAAGFTLAVAEDTAVLHKEGGSDTSRRSIRTDRYVTASALHFLRRHAPVPVLSQALYLALRFAHRLVRGRGSNVRAVLHGVHDFHRGSSAEIQ